MMTALDRRFPEFGPLVITAGGVAALGLSSVVAGGLVSNPAFVRMSFTLCIGALVVGLGIRAPRPVLYGMIVWLAALGLIRRLLTLGFSGPVTADPLLLVEPLALLILLVVASEQGAFRTRTRLGSAMLVFVALIGFGALNPIQGSLVAGLSALIFFMPLAAFWIGRTLSDAMLKRALLVYAVCAIPAAVYGLLQISSGFPSWDQAWIDSSGYAALQVGSATRPFSSFSSASEYAMFLAASMMIWLLLVRRVLRPVAIGASILLGISVFYQSSRGSVVAICVAVALVLGARRGLPLIGSIVVAVGLLAMVPMTVKHLAPASYGTDSKSQLVAHQVEGLSNPFDAKQSTAAAHISLVTGGIHEAFREPLGNGISTVTIAGSKFGSSVVGGSEADPSNAAIALGIPGLAVYLLVLGLGLSGAYRLARRTREPLPLAALAILVVVFPQWLNGGAYAVAFLPWLLLGWVDGKSTRTPAVEEELPGPKPIFRRPRLQLVPRVSPPARLSLAPQRWELWRLERIARAHARSDPDRAEERSLLLFALRPYASADGRLPPEFDGLVREEFGRLLGAEGLL